MLRDLKYLLAYIIPGLMAMALYYKGLWSFAVIVFSFGIIPLLDFLLPISTLNPSSKRKRRLKKSRFFDYVLYVNVPIVYGLLGYYLYLISFTFLETFEVVGLTISMGIILGTAGINVAHELGHRYSDFAKFCSKLLLLPSIYLHFTVEHNRGHHKNVATPKDPATARKNQSIYAFWVQTIIGSWKSAWRIERKRLRKQSAPVIGLNNEMVQIIIIELGYISGLFWLLGMRTTILVLSAAFIAVLLLETINYIEHYGLKREKTESGLYERTQARHSWNSNHILGRIMLYELTRHSDHHFYASKKYQLLEHLEGSPQLPLGYPGSMLMTFIPPLWFAKVNPLLD